MIKVFSLFIVLLLFSACGTKREYYEPEKVQGKLSYDEKLPSKISETNLNFATLKNDEVLSKSGIIEGFELPKDFTLLVYEADEFVIADKDGNLRIVGKANEEIYSHKFDAAVLSVAMSGDDLALLLADNTIVLANRSLGIKMSQTLTPAPAQDSRVASPYFMGSIIIFPTLDGKLVVVDKASQKVLRDIVISSADFFNNVIYLNVVNNLMIAATSKKVVVVSENETFSYSEEIRSAVVAGDFIFIFAKNGTVIKTDLALKKVAEKKFKYAILNESSVFKGFLYVFEKTGYLIKSDLNLEQAQVFRLKSATDEKGFMREGRFYFSNKVLNLP